MAKRSIAILLVLVMVGGLMAACAPEKEPISQAEAVNVAMKHMGITNDDQPTIHVHEGTYKNQTVYNVYVTVGNVSKTYVIAVNGGEIIGVMDGSGHSH